MRERRSSDRGTPSGSGRRVAGRRPVPAARAPDDTATGPWRHLRGALRSFVKVAVALGVVSLLAGTGYALKVQPWVEDRLVGTSRLDVQVLRQPQFTPRALPHTGIWLFPSGSATPQDVPARLRGLDRYHDFQVWAAERGAIPAQTLSLRLTVRGVGDEPVVLHDVRAEVVRRSKPPVGWYRFPDAGCGVQPVRSIGIDLEAAPPLVTTDDGTGRGGPGPFTDTFRVTRTDTEVFEVHAEAARHDVEFRLVLVYPSSRGDGELVVGGDRTFRVTALRPERATAWDSSAGSKAPLRRKPDGDPSADGLAFC